MDRPEEKDLTVFISHGGCLEDAQTVADMVRKRFGVEEIVINYVELLVDIVPVLPVLLQKGEEVLLIFNDQAVHPCGSQLGAHLIQFVRRGVDGRSLYRRAGCHSI